MSLAAKVLFRWLDLLSASMLSFLAFKRVESESNRAGESLAYPGR
jgi:hypothetical protein